jgi:polar amino acid transport system permease protein
MADRTPSPIPETPMASPHGEVYVPSQLRVERERVRRRDTVRSALIAAASTIVFGIVLVVVITGSPGWPRVRESFFNWSYGRDALPAIAQGMLVNLRVMAVSAVCILIIGLVLAVLRTLRSPVAFPLRLLATAYTDLFRGLPLILVILLLGLGVPGLRLRGLPDSALFYGGAALVLTYSAYVAEVFRAGIESVHPSQRAAARSLGLTHGQTMRYVILPQGVRRVVPPLLNDLVSLQKDSGLVSILGAIDAVRAAGIETATTFNFTPYVVAGGLFVVLTIPMTRFTDWVSARAARRQSQGGAA